MCLAIVIMQSVSLAIKVNNQRLCNKWYPTILWKEWAMLLLTE